MSDYATWSMELGNLSRKFPIEKFTSIVEKVGLDALRAIVFYSPVGNPSLWKAVIAGHPAPHGYVGGHFRNNWFVDVNKTAVLRPQQRDSIDKAGTASLSESSKFSALKDDPYQFIYIHNSLPYAIRLEEGHSTQAPGPAAIIGRTFNDLKTVLSF